MTPDCSHCHAYEYADLNYTVTLTTESGESKNETAANDTMLELMLEGYECEGITIEISLPGNCHPVTLTAALLLGNTALTSQRGPTCRVCCVCFTADPVYPKPAGLKFVLLNNTSFALTWAHPSTGALLEVEDEEYTYSVKGDVAATNESVFQYNTNISSSTAPWEVVDVSGRECQEIEFSISLERDCRELYTTASLPLCECLICSQSETYTI